MCEFKDDKNKFLFNLCIIFNVYELFAVSGGKTWLFETRNYNMKIKFSECLYKLKILIRENTLCSFIDFPVDWNTFLTMTAQFLKSAGKDFFR